MADAPLIVARGLTKRFGDVVALDGLDAVIPKGVVGLLGPNGAGKSTFLKTILGLETPDAGSASVLGVDVATEGRRIRARVGYMPEKDCHFPGLSAVDVVALCGELSGLSKSDAFRRAHETLHYAGMSETRYRLVDSFSAGLRQRVKFAAALVHDPDFLVLDEPTNGLDPEGRREFLDLVKEVGRNGASILLSTHLLSDVEEVCDRVLVVGKGRASLEGPVASLLSDASNVRAVRVQGESGPFLEALARRFAKATFDPAASEFRVELPEGASAAIVLEAAAETGTRLKGLRPARSSLERVFLDAVGARRADS
jgi:ABC-2 type transport system ATP-binding protein